MKRILFFTVDSKPTPAEGGAILPTQKIVSDGESFQIPGAGAVTANIANNVLTFTQASV